MAVINTTQTLYVEECANCHILFAYPEWMHKNAVADHSEKFYCPNGHRLSYLGKSEAERLQDENARLTHRLDQATADADYERKQHIVTKGKLTKVRNRINAGVCVECNRTFPNLASHMADKHHANTYAKHEGGLHK